ncbi:MAG: hypothetical protein HY906_21070 [Deltaproteobacteria bacterium]|nr:hypothetical protein [Deltaproteobacteria bacterium]
MMHIILGLFFVALGIWGIFDEWYYVLDCLKGGGSLVLLVAGLIAMIAGAFGKPAQLPDPTAEDEP